MIGWLIKREEMRVIESRIDTHLKFLGLSNAG